MSRLNKCPKGCTTQGLDGLTVVHLNKVDENSFMYTCSICRDSFIYEIPPGFHKCLNCEGWGCLTCNHVGILSWVDVAKGVKTNGFFKEKER